ncbi:hypothetical protein OHA91_01140 [Streptomyces erythrochromogenes]|uniref:SH3 domain-containing protein n=1 Tax=Streptomyces erythrochromogenes TaxID=285574 RepID=A0ABZ1Q490_9ACTN|nr:hypothetical protein [Streptomyces erythrochromogenes]
MTHSSPTTRRRGRLGTAGLRSLAGLLLAFASILMAGAQPAAAHPPSGSVHVWASDVRVRTCQRASCSLATTERLTNVRVQAYCQMDGGAAGRVTDGAYTNTYWVQIITPGRTLGWISAVYASGGSNNSPVPGAPVYHPGDATVDCEFI